MGGPGWPQGASGSLGPLSETRLDGGQTRTSPGGDTSGVAAGETAPVDGLGLSRKSALVEQVGRRWSGCCRCGGEPEMGENLPDDDGVLDGGHHPHAAATPGARQHVHPERMPHQLRPRPLPHQGEAGAPPRSRSCQDHDSSPAETTAVRSGVLRASRRDRGATGLLRHPSPAAARADRAAFA